ncbi:M14 family metallopeptidase [Streptomyces sp. UNOC14_S4]|uniref:M14 family metallopeptidase n=1 Tax=Streptomyces sp. UNOC14_S4 TaxID=2872340 RepID=UPI001E4F24AE|nr:M14 family metallopeptidase [Streptomyces sp. UNOC14_S4]MCC3770753.1 M14 family metallopeptidase [Streptomyces sp. UNOC14_S4]
MTTPFSGFFSESYAEARSAFLTRATARGAALSSHRNTRATGPGGEPLYTDVARIGPPGARRVVLCVSGTHGIEGYAGSALQCALLADGYPYDTPGVAFVAVHALNPFGFAHRRRVDEDNVDVNRNFVDHARPPANAHYAGLHPFLVPGDWEGPAHREADARLGEFAAVHGLRALQQAVTQGQWTHPDGLFHGGTAPSWSHRTLRDVVAEHTAGAEAVAYVDLHTGLGAPGAVEPIFRGGRDAGAPARARAWYGPALTASEDGTSSSTPITGNSAGLVADVLGDGPELTAITLEMGTADGLAVLTALRADNWLWLHPAARPARAEDFARRMSAAFYPDDPGWRDAVLRAGTGVLHAALAGLAPEARPRPVRP